MRTVSVLCCVVAVANAAQWDMIGDIDGEAANDESGYSVAMSSNGTRIAIGAQYNDGGGTSSGHVRVYNYDGAVWSQVGLDIDGEAANDLSGTSVAMSSDGTRIAIGARLNDGGGTDSGHVRVYNYNGTGWSQVGLDIDGEAENDYSGFSVAMSSDGTRIAIGAPSNDGGGPSTSNSGHVRVYDYNGTAWIMIGDIDGEAANDFFGTSVGVAMSSDGTRIAIGAPHNDGGGPSTSNSGHVRVYDYNGTAWNQVGLDIDGEAANDFFGTSVAMSSDGTRIAIGARHNSGVNGGYSGHVRVYDYNGTAWSQVGEDIDGEAVADESGWRVAMSSDGDIIAIGARYNSGVNGDYSGHVRVYNYDGTAWSQIGEDIDGEAASDKSGWSVAMSSDGTRIAIGAPERDGNESNAGHVRVFEYKQEEVSREPTLSVGAIAGIAVGTIAILALALL